MFKFQSAAIAAAALSALAFAAAPVAFAQDAGAPEEVEAAVAAGGERITVDVLGAVCDFCAIAMTRTFERRDEVEAAYVDLDAKTLSIALKPGAEMSDETIADLITRSGYDQDGIRRDGEG